MAGLVATPNRWDGAAAMAMGDLARQDDYDPLIPPPPQPLKPAQDIAYGMAKGLTVDPLIDAYRAVSGQMTEDEQRNMAFGAAMGLLPMRAAGPLAKATSKMGALAEPIRAYHSSPHDFERFDPSKIGTGEGAQVYGYGHYFAENPAVSGQGGQYWNQFARRFKGPELDAAEYLRSNNFDREMAIKNMNDLIADMRAKHPERLKGMIGDYEQAVKLLESGKPVGPRTYEVDIKARPEQFLDWDKPISAQSTGVQSGLQPMIDKELNMILRTGDPRFNDLRKSLESGGVSGRELYNRQRSRPETSQQLNQAGIPGIKYLDQGSRNIPNQEYVNGLVEHFGSLEKALEASKQKLASAKTDFDRRSWAEAVNQLQMPPPTSNYVVFPGNEDLIAIMRKYGLAGMAPAGVLGSLAAQDRYEPQ
jgi:hypothetical protein